ncbi:MAG: hypothetical protein ABMA14_07880 [Hyphomonadaceae bacterium]
MSLDQSVACRRAPKLPSDLPRAGEWKKTDYKGIPVYTLDGGKWLVNVMVESEFPKDLIEQLVEDLADTGIAGAYPADYPVLVSVSLEPVTSDDDALELQMAVLDMLVETCDGIVMAN